MGEDYSVRNVIGDTIIMTEENGRHFRGPVPDERECPGRQFRVKAIPVKGAQTSTFMCLRCNRELEGLRLPGNDSRLLRKGGEIA